MSFNTILLEKRGRVGLVTLNRPKALNRSAPNWSPNSNRR